MVEFSRSCVGGPWKVGAPQASLVAGGALTDGVNGARLMHWSEVYEVTKTFWSIHWKELKLTGGRGRGGEKGYFQMDNTEGP